MTGHALAADLSVDGFVAWEEARAEKYERVGGVVRLMAGGTSRHDTICNNLRLALPPVGTALQLADLYAETDLADAAA